MTELYRLPEYVILDFETTGLDETQSEIIEIGAIRVVGLQEKERYHTLIQPKGPVPEIITQLTGITPEMLKSAPTFADALPGFLDFVRDLPLVAHNSQLEQKFLDHHVAPLTALESFTVHNSIDALAMIYPDHGSLSLEAMRKWANVSLENSHRADKDCEDLLKVMAHAQEWMQENRPHIAGIVTELLHPDWWWSWYFQDERNDAHERPADFLTQVLERPFKGELKELRSQDLAREIDWSKAIPAEEVRRKLQVQIPLTPGTDELPKFSYREPQEKMAQEIRAALSKGERIAIEAPTGTGKSVAYLLPGVLAAEASGAPLVISTHSKALQDQLLEKDIPIVRNLTSRPELRATTVKGQENYLCLRKLHDLIESVAANGKESSSTEERWSAAFLVAFASVSTIAELDRVSHYLKGRFPTLVEHLDWVKSHHTTTLGPKCPFYKSCHFYDSARTAHQSDVIIANHALVFQWPAHLPQIRNLVFDEAHHLEDQLTEAYSIRLSEETIADNLDRLSRKRGKQQAGDSTQIARLMNQLTLPIHLSEHVPSDYLIEMADAIRAKLTLLRGAVPLALAPGKDRSDGYEEHIAMASLKSPARETILEGFNQLASSLGAMATYLAAGVQAAESGPLKKDPAFDVLTTQADRFESYHQKIKTLIFEGEPNHLRLLHWNPRENVWRMSIAPIEVAKLATDFFGTKRSIVLTSATLSSGSAPTFVTDRIGLQLSRPFVSLPSPYRLQEQAVAFIPNDVAQPGTPSHFESLVGFTEQVATLLGGRTLLLMTANRRLTQAANILREKLKPHGITVLDSVTDRRAAETFKTTERALLIGSERYGEGLDIPGRALTCVIVEKINETMTRSPIAEARKARTKFGLYDYDFPLRMMWLKQRVGRLIRSATDTGYVVVFDSRYHAWSAGSRNHVNRALAPIPIQDGTPEQIVMKIERLEKQQMEKAREN